MNTDNTKYCEAVLQVVYISKQPFYSRLSGSAFVVSYKEKLFIITASHCLDEENINDLFFSKLATNRKCYSIPIVAQIKSFDVTATEIDTDLRIFKVDDKAFNNNIIENASIKTDYEYAQEILRTPYIQRMKRLYKNNPHKRLKKVKTSKLYNTLLRHQEEEVNKAIINANTSLAEIKNLVLASKDFLFTKDKDCIIIGYSFSDSSIDYNDNGTVKYGNQYLEVYHGKLTGEYNQINDTYSLVPDTNENLNGFSGGPVIADGKVVGVLSYIKEKKLYFIPIQRIIQSLDYWFTKYPE